MQRITIIGPGRFRFTPEYLAAQGGPITERTTTMATSETWAMTRAMLGQVGISADTLAGVLAAPASDEAAEPR